MDYSFRKFDRPLRRWAGVCDNDSVCVFFSLKRDAEIVSSVRKPAQNQVSGKHTLSWGLFKVIETYHVADGHGRNDLGQCGDQTLV